MMYILIVIGLGFSRTVTAIPFEDKPSCEVVAEKLRHQPVEVIGCFPAGENA